MVQIRNKATGRIFKLSGANIEDATNDSVIVNRVVTHRFKDNWHNVFSHYIRIGRNTQCLLYNNYEVVLKEKPVKKGLIVKSK